MSERKVLNKYYPPDYDPSKVPRIKRKNKQHDVRIMAPFNMKCTTCGNYIANATKFNAKKETIEDETYNKLMIFRFYIKCTRCMGTIVFRTNPKEVGYEVEHGATECFMALKMAERQAREEAEAEEEEEKINPMKHLENRTKASRQQMEASDQIQQLRSIKHKYHSVDLNAVLENKRQERIEADGPLALEDGTNGEQDEDQIRAEARKMLKRKTLELQTTTTKPAGHERETAQTSSGKSRQLTSSLSSLKKKIKIVPKTAKVESNCDKKD